MISETRAEVFNKMEEYRKLINLEDKDVLEVGIAGDPKPGGNYRFFGAGNRYKTLDRDAQYEPDHVCDIKKTYLDSQSVDLIIISQTIEHMTHPEEAVRESHRLLRKNGYLIIDSPWMYEYHAADDFEDYARYSNTGLEAMCREYGFKIMSSSLTTNLASCLAKK